jgi:hypothetical protein
LREMSFLIQAAVLAKAQRRKGREGESLVVTGATFPKTGTPRPTNAHFTNPNAWPA